MNQIQAITNIPTKIREKYTPLEIRWRTAYSTVIEACSKENSSEKFLIRILNPCTPQIASNYNFAATMFIQELLFLSSRLLQEKEFMIEDFQIESQSMGYVTKSYSQLREAKEGINLQLILRSPLKM